MKPQAAVPAGRWARWTMALSRDKADTLLLLGTTLLVLIPHAAHLPPWISALCGATLLWRAIVTFQGRRMPPSMLLLPISLLAMAGVFASFNTLLGRDSGVAMLVLLVAFKMLEMRARRDLYVVVFLCFFLVLTNFFYSQTIATALLMMASVLLLLLVQLSFQFTGAVPPLRARLWMASRILLLAAPLAALLFVVFPRVQGPLWGMPGDALKGRSGLSTSMAPGNLANLALSDEVAFRVRFIDPAPPQPRLYWRGVVLGDFDGRTWTQVRRRADASAQDVAITVRGERIRHEVTLEPSTNRWLFALEVPEQLPRIAGNPAAVSTELEMVAAAPLSNRVRYQVASYPAFSLQADDALPDAARWLALPRGFNPRTLQAGIQLRALAPAERVRDVLRRFSSDGFVYTLEPALLGRDSIDEFLFTTRAGFCEHYAGAFVFLMRAAGVPARVVTGYQGGEINPIDGYMTVRQSDAHAWAEVWLSNRGWVRVDPTAAASPRRLQQSAARMLPRPAPFGLPQLGALMELGGDGRGVIAQLRYRFAALNNGWNQWVLNYTPERQRSLLDEARFGAHWPYALAIAALLTLLYLARRLRLAREKDPIDALYSALSVQMGRLGLARRPDEGPNAWAARLSRSDLPAETRAALARFLQLYSAHKYAATAPAARLAATLKQLKSQITQQS